MRLSRLSIFALVLAAAACGGDDDEDAGPQAQRGPARPDSVARKPIYPEAEAAQILRVINENEIATARVARERTQNDDIMRFANVMFADHRAMTQLLDSILPPIADTINPEGKRLVEGNKQFVDSLWALPGGFNNTYIENQVREHERTLILLDTALIPSARNPQLKKLLQDLRPAVVAHLQRAKQIYAARMANPATATPTAAVPRPTSPTPAPTTPRVDTPPPPRTDTVFTPALPPPTSTSNM
jgi:putative membrane protein